MPTRRQLLQGLAATSLLGVGGAALSSRRGGLRAATPEPTYCVVFSLFGGASAIDCFMPVSVTDPLRGVDSRGKVIAHAVTTEPSSVFKVVDRTIPRTFHRSHYQQMLAMGMSATSASHFVAQERVLNGKGVFHNRTLSEAMAAVHGGGFPLPNVHLGRGGFVVGGRDATLDSTYLGERVTSATTFGLATHGYKGVLRGTELPGGSIDDMAALVDRARVLRTDLEGVSPFGRTFANSGVRRGLVQDRHGRSLALESADLQSQLFYHPDGLGAFPLEEYGLSNFWLSDEVNAETVIAEFPGALPAGVDGVPGDATDAQAALAFLLLASGASCCVTITESGADGYSAAFDFGHSSHEGSQKDYWDRALQRADALIRLLKKVDIGGGKSMWDRTFLVFATEFGRDKRDTRTGSTGDFGTGHHLNNGLLMVSPLVKGNQALGQVDPTNGWVCGFDATTGVATPFQASDLDEGGEPLASSPRLPPYEPVVFGTMLKAVGVEYEGQEYVQAALL